MREKCWTWSKYCKLKKNLTYLRKKCPELKSNTYQLNFNFMTFKCQIFIDLLLLNENLIVLSLTNLILHYMRKPWHFSRTFSFVSCIAWSVNEFVQKNSLSAIYKMLTNNCSGKILPRNIFRFARNGSWNDREKWTRKKYTFSFSFTILLFNN